MNKVMRISEYDKLVEQIELDLCTSAPLVTWQLLRAHQMPRPIQNPDEFIPDAAPLELRIKVDFHISGSSLAFDRWFMLSLVEYNAIGDEFIDHVRHRVARSAGVFLVGL